MPLISIVITTYDRPDFLRQAIASAAAQTYRNTEIIVIDDCSPAVLESVVLEFEFPIHYFRHRQRMGANHARNTGVRLACGDYIACLDDDDIWLPEKLATQLQTINDANACLCGYEYLDSGKKFVRPIREVTANMLRAGNRFCGMSGLLCRRDWLLSNPFDNTLRNGQDWDIFVRLARESPISYAPQSLFCYRRGEHSSITTQVKSFDAGDFDTRLAVAHKHHAWLGEHYFRLRVARTILAYIGVRRERWQLVRHAVRESGLYATASVLIEKISNFLKRGGIANTH